MLISVILIALIPGAVGTARDAQATSHPGPGPSARMLALTQRVLSSAGAMPEQGATWRVGPSGASLVLMVGADGADH
jgi:hypothetical protein